MKNSSRFSKMDDYKKFRDLNNIPKKPPSTPYRALAKSGIKLLGIGGGIYLGHKAGKYVGNKIKNRNQKRK